MKLAIGPGEHRKAGWLSLDADPNRGADFFAKIPPLPGAVKDIQWDEIEWIHGITSVYPWEAQEILAELCGVLKPGGKLILEQPNFLEAKQRVEWLFGDPTLKNPWHMNRWSWVPEDLINAALKAGFSKAYTLPAQHHVPARDFRVEAYR